MTKLAKIIAGVAFAVAITVFGFWWFVLDRDNPEEVSIRTADEQLDEDLRIAGADPHDSAPGAPADPAASVDPGADPEAPTDPGADPEAPVDPGAPADPAASATGEELDMNGTWVVDDEIGSFDFETASGSFAGFRVDEVLTFGEVVAVGRTGGVTGTLTIEDDTLTAVEVTADMTTIVSDDSRRERAIRGAVDADRFGEATFVLTEPVTLPEGVAPGASLAVEAIGDLTVKGATNEIALAIDAIVRPDGIGVIVGSAEIVWEDFGVTPPSAPIVISVEPRGIVEFQLILRRA